MLLVLRNSDIAVLNYNNGINLSFYNFYQSSIIKSKSDYQKLTEIYIILLLITI